MRLTEIIGLLEKHAILLEKEGIKNVEDLIPLSYNQIRKLTTTVAMKNMTQ